MKRNGWTITRERRPLSRGVRYSMEKAGRFYIGYSLAEVHAIADGREPTRVLLPSARAAIVRQRARYL